MIGNNTVNQIDKELYFFNSILNIETGETVSGVNVIWTQQALPIQNTIQLSETYSITIRQTKKRVDVNPTFIKIASSSESNPIFFTSPWPSITVEGTYIEGGKQLTLAEGSDVTWDSEVLTTERIVGRGVEQSSYPYQVCHLWQTTVTYSVEFKREPADYNADTVLKLNTAKGDKILTIKGNASTATTSWSESSTVPSSLTDDLTLISSDGDISLRVYQQQFLVASTR